jgi:hypothetical protein
VSWQHHVKAREPEASSSAFGMRCGDNGCRDMPTP